MDDVTISGGEKAGAPVESKALLSESEFKEWAAKTDAMVFDFRYRGLTEEEIGAAWTFEGDTGPFQETAFTQSLPVPNEKKVLFRFPLLRSSKIGVLEYEEKTVQALYLDVNGDGKLDPGEKLEPFQSPPCGAEVWFFVTPDFAVIAPDGKKRPYRVLAQVDLRNKPETAKPRVMLASFCLWEADLTVEGKAIALRLTDVDFDGSFLTFGEDSLESSDGPVKNKKVDLLPGDRLSTLIRLSPLSLTVGYQMRFTGEGTQEEPWRAALCKDPNPPGEIEPVLFLADPKAELKRVRWAASEMPTSLFDQHATETKLPQGRYRIVSGDILSGGKTISIRNSSECRVVAGQKTVVKLGGPRLKLEAVEESGPNKTAAEEKTTFPCNADVYIELKLVGIQGEEYGYSRKYAGYEKYAISLENPQLEISGPDGPTVSWPDLGPRKGDNCGFLWKIRNQKPGRYTVKAQGDTGSFAGKLETELEITLTGK